MMIFMIYHWFIIGLRTSVTANFNVLHVSTQFVCLHFHGFLSLFLCKYLDIELYIVKIKEIRYFGRFHSETNAM